MMWRNYPQILSLKIQNKLSIYLHQYTKVLYSFVSIFYQVEVYRNILKVSCSPLGFTACKAFLKNKNRSGTSLPALFSVWFLKNNIPLVIF